MSLKTEVSLIDIQTKLVNDSTLTEVMVKLWSRWQDESEYEDLRDYQKFLTPYLPDTIKMEKMTKRPFGFTFMVPAYKTRLHLTVRRGAGDWVTLRCGPTKTRRTRPF